MKRIKYLFLVSFLFLFFYTIIPVTRAQQPPPLPPATGHGMKGDQPSGNCSAPLDGGLTLLLIMGAGYGIGKTGRKQKKKLLT